MKKSYSVDVQDGELVSIEIDGVIFHSVDEIPDEDDRAHAEFLMKDAEDMEFDKGRFLGKSQPSRMPLIMFLLFLSIAILLLIISAFSAVSAIRSTGKEQSLPGRVVSMIERRGSDPNRVATRSSDRNLGGNDSDIYYYPEVEITLPDETTKRLQLGQGSWPPAYEVGQQVTVLYNAEHPKDSSIQSSGSTIMKFLPAMITGFIGLGFLSASLLVRWISKPDPEEEQKSSEQRFSRSGCHSEG